MKPGNKAINPRPIVSTNTLSSNTSLSTRIVLKKGAKAIIAGNNRQCREHKRQVNNHHIYRCYVISFFTTNKYNLRHQVKNLTDEIVYYEPNGSVHSDRAIGYLKMTITSMFQLIFACFFLGFCAVHAMDEWQ